MGDSVRGKPARNIFAYVLVGSVLLLLLLVSSCALVVSFRPPASLDDAACARFQIMSAAFFACAVALAAFGRAAGAWLASVALSLRDMAASARRRLREFFSTEDRWHQCALYAIVLFAIVFRLYPLARPVDYDESYTLHKYVLPGVFEGLLNHNLPNDHVFHSALSKAACTLVGNRPWMLRLPVFFAGLLVIPMTYIAARRLYDKHVGLLAAGLVACSTLFVYHSTTARGYMIVALIFMAILALATWIKDRASPGGWFLFALLSTLGIFTIPNGLYAFGIVLAWILLSSFSRDAALERRALLWKLAGAVLLAGALTLALYAPVFAVTGLAQMTPAPNWLELQGWGVMLSEMWRDWNLGFPLLLQIAIVAGVVAAAVFHRRVRRARAFAPAAAILFLAPVLLIQWTPPFARVLTFLFPLYLLTAAAGILLLLQACGEWVAARRAMLASAAAVLLAASVGFSALPQSRLDPFSVKDAEDITLFLKPRLGPRVPIVMDFPMDSPLRYYFIIDNVPLQHLVRAYPVPQELHLVDTMLVVVARKRGQTIDEFLKKCKLYDRPDAGRPFVVYRGESDDVYQLGNNVGWPITEFDPPPKPR